MLLGGLLACGVASSAELVGRASVIDGDTLEINGERIRLEGIDAPESRQTCSRQGKPWRCGQLAALALSDWIGVRTVVCVGHGRDRYSRVLARCSVAGDDMQAWLVANGHALAYRRYSTDYVSHEELAARCGWCWQEPHRGHSPATDCAPGSLDLRISQSWPLLPDRPASKSARGLGDALSPPVLVATLCARSPWPSPRPTRQPRSFAHAKI